MSGRDLLLGAVALKNVTPVAIPDLPELDGKIFVRVMTAGERQLWAEMAVKAQGSGVFVADYEIVAICACESDGSPMFHTRDAEGRLRVASEDIANLLKVDGRAIAAIAQKALEVSGLDLGATDRAKKDSPNPQNDDSTSSSPPVSAEA